MGKSRRENKFRKVVLDEMRSRAKSKKIMETFEADPEKQQPRLRKAHEKRLRKANKRLGIE